MHTPSETMKSILENKEGYRNDSLSEGIFFAHDIIEHEIEELGNIDIPDTCLRMYANSNAHAIVYHRFPTASPKNPVYGLWLTDEDGVKTHYNGDEEGYSKYRLPDDAVILSDIGTEGILIATQTNPKQLVTEHYEAEPEEDDLTFYNPDSPYHSSPYTYPYGGREYDDGDSDFDDKK